MNLTIFYILGLSFLLNLIIYFEYKFYLVNKMNLAIEKIKEYEDRIEKIASPKRKNKTLRKISKEVEYYTRKFRDYILIQSLTLIFVYLVGLLIIAYLITSPIYFPYNLPLITLIYHNKHIINNLFVYIISFLLFTPLSLRKPKII